MSKLLLDNIKITAPSQYFLDIVDVVNGIVILRNGDYVLIVEVKPVNFALLNPDEQGFLIRRFAAFLNSLDFPIQILIDNKKLVMQDYLVYLEEVTQKVKLNPQMHAYFEIYKQFVNNILEQKTVFDKKFFIVVKHHAQTYNPKAPAAINKQILEMVYNNLIPKVQHIITNFKHMGLDAHVLSTPEVVKTFYRYYNPEDKSIRLKDKTINL